MLENAAVLSALQETLPTLQRRKTDVGSSAETKAGVKSVSEKFITLI